MSYWLLRDSDLVNQRVPSVRHAGSAAFGLGIKQWRGSEKAVENGGLKKVVLYAENRLGVTALSQTLNSSTALGWYSKTRRRAQSSRMKVCEVARLE